MGADTNDHDFGMPYRDKMLMCYNRGVLYPVVLQAQLLDPMSGVYFYNIPGRSFGFAETSVVNLDPCDISNPGSATRICWHTLAPSIGGYRAGTALGLNYDSRYRKIVYARECMPLCLCSIHAHNSLTVPTINKQIHR